MRYLLCFFPFVGVFVGALLLVVCALERRFFPRGPFLFPLALTLAPLFVTGGIHMDGFMDTCDALASRGRAEERVSVMHDPHVGAFAVMGAASYLLARFALCAELLSRFGGAASARSFSALVAFALSPAVSRLLSALSVCAFPKADGSSLLRAFSDAAARRFTLVWCAFFLALAFVLLAAACGRPGLAVIVSSLAAFAWYFSLSRRRFGGTTGDLAGWFVQVCELLCLLGVCVA